MKKTILVIDDNQDILQAIKIILEDEGYDVLVSEDGKVAEELSGNLPGLIVLDVLLSGKDGREIVRALKTREETKNIPVIMISAHPSAKKSALDSGADAFLPKPFDTDEFLESIHHHLTISYS